MIRIELFNKSVINYYSQNAKGRRNIMTNVSTIDFNAKKGFICDMDGVIYHGNQVLPGVAEFLDWLHEEKKEYLFLTNNSGYTPTRTESEARTHGAQRARAAFLYERARNGGFPARSGTRLLCVRYRRGGPAERSLRCGHHDERRQPRLCRCRRGSLYCSIR